MPYSVRAIQQVIEELAPAALAESWDNVGLLVGDPEQQVATVLVALDATDDVLEQASTNYAELVVTHHPLIFSSLKRLVEDRSTVSLARRLVREGRSLIAAHTNLDSAPAGLNACVAELLGLTEGKPLVPSTAHPLLKLVVYVPQEQVDAVREAICRAGAGQIGNYSECTFGMPGTGTFRPGAGTSPFIGTQGELERVEEVRLETVVPRAALGRVLSAMFAGHPYEEVAYDLFPMENAWPGAGLGRIGTLTESMPAGQFLQRIRDVLGAPRAALLGNPNQSVRTVALCTGAGGDFTTNAAKAGADLYLTGEVKHHQALYARDRGLAVIDAGHYALERPAVPLLAGLLRKEFPELKVVEAQEHDPWGY